jgi:sugar phosphate isomerase/epimerase
VRFGYENHPERTSAELLDKIGDEDEDVIGACLDTGWFGTYGYDAAQALREVGPRLIYLHLKDVAAKGGHDTVRLGTGVVPVKACVQVVKELGYKGGISIEHEPEHFNPDEDVKAGLELVREWLR